MISGLIDELNKSADEWNGSNMFELARMCRDAADTIWQLRDDLQRANAENAKLRNDADLLRAMLSQERTEKRCHMADNAKLRELVRELWAQAEQNLVCDENCPYGATCNWMDSDVVCVFKRRMRELGVEVD